MVRSLVGLEREKVGGTRKKLGNEELHDVYCSLRIRRVITLRWMR
jgi:hypothetical protein